MERWTPKVDCVSYFAIDEFERAPSDEELDNARLRGTPLPKFKVVNEVWATCSHPEREGYQKPDGQYGCVLVDFETGKLIEGAVCDLQTRHGTPEEDELQRRMQEIRDKEEFPF